MEKRLRRDADVGDGALRPWCWIGTNLLTLILQRLTTDEMARVAPFVCTAWAAALRGPDCWVDIDIEEWCRRCDDEVRIGAVVRRMIRKTFGKTQRLSAFKMSGRVFPFVARFGACLKELRIPMSSVSDVMVEKNAGFFKSLMILDISHCIEITSKGMEYFGKRCPKLVYLKRNLPLPEILTVYGANHWKVDESEAMAVANFMTGLQHLELCYGSFTDRGLDAILNKCGGLTYLSVHGCWNVKLEGSLEERCLKIPFFVDPWNSGWETSYESSLSGGEGDDSDG